MKAIQLLLTWTNQYWAMSVYFISTRQRTLVPFKPITDNKSFCSRRNTGLTNITVTQYWWFGYWNFHNWLFPTVSSTRNIFSLCYMSLWQLICDIGQVMVAADIWMKVNLAPLIFILPLIEGVVYMGKKFLFRLFLGIKMSDSSIFQILSYFW